MIRHLATAGAAFFGSAALCTSALAAGPAPMPALSDVLSASPAPQSGDCVMFTNGVCVCEMPEVVRVIDLTCGPATNPGEQVCSYSRLIEDGARLNGPYWDQRMDVFGVEATGAWQLCANTSRMTHRV